ncbi:MAG: tocopherol cyclase family protein [Eubacteriales bacterium]|nr:tocopherol cyclase family protein [Eubacteriales bacterium]
MANISDIRRDQFMLKGPLAGKGYDWWWHSFTGYHEKTGEAKGFFIEFFTCNPKRGGAKPVFGQSSETARPSYLMVKCGAWGEKHAQLHRFFAWSDVKIRRKVPFAVKAGNCLLDENCTAGEVTVTAGEAAAHPERMSDSGSMRWKLTIDKKTAFHVGYGAAGIFRKMNAFEMFWHAEGMKTEYAGWVEYNGERYLVRPQDCYGYADKNWGGDFTSPWVWLSSCHLTSLRTGKQLEDSVFDIGGGCPKAFGIALKRKLLSDFWYEGQDYEFNFSKFWTGTRTKFACEESETQIIWHVEQETFRAKMVTDITCEKKDMLLFNYESPDGYKRHNRLWNGGNGVGTVKLYAKKLGRLTLLDEIRAENVGCEYGEY